MIDHALLQIATQLNQHLRLSFQLTEDIVVLSNLMEMDGTSAPSCQNKLVIFLAGIKNNPSKNQESRSGMRQQAQANKNSLANVNLMMMCAANFSGNQYPEALKFLSATIQFFQENAIFDHDNSPNLDPQLDKLMLAVEDLSLSEMNTLWRAYAGHYLPSILYRVQVVSNGV